MSVIVFAQVRQPPPAPAGVTVQNITHTWTGWDGSEWIFNRANGVWLAPAGIRGMNMPTITRYTRTSAALNGSVFRGFIVPEREVFWPLRIAAPNQLDFAGIDSAFWDTMLPHETGVWTVTQPGGESRSLTCRFSDDGQMATTAPAFSIGQEWYGITLIAEDPFWYGKKFSQTWRSPKQYLFFGGGDPDADPAPTQAAPPFYISDSNGYGSATARNNGDVETWWKAAVDGPCSSATVGTDSASVAIPFAVPDGKRLVIDSNPQVQTAIMGDPIVKANGDLDETRMTEVTGTLTDRTKDLGSVSWASIPPRQDVSLAVSTVDGGSVTVEFAQPHLRAW